MGKTFEELKREILSCRDCQDRFGFAPHPIVRGNAHSRIVQISQAPSGNVHKTLMPFDDASGRKLRGEWYRIPDGVFYDPDNFYITSIAHCYPGKAPGGGDRLPPKHCAEQWLRREIALIDNDMFILIGAKAADFFFPKEDFTALVFRDHRIHGKPAYVLPHPSPLNVKWFKDHPEFLRTRVRQIEEAVHRVLGL